MIREKKIVITLGIIFVIWSIVAFFHFLLTVCVGITYADAMARHSFAVNNLINFAPSLIIWILLGWALVISFYFYKKKK